LLRETSIEYRIRRICSLGAGDALCGVGHGKVPRLRLARGAEMGLPALPRQTDNLVVAGERSRAYA
jgi:hypothetical protein